MSEYHVQIFDEEDDDNLIVREEFVVDLRQARRIADNADSSRYKITEIIREEVESTL